MQALEQVAETLRILAHPCRLKIIELLEHKKQAPVYELAKELGLPQAATSHHLGHMKRAGLIANERNGKEVWYRISDTRSLTILDCIRGRHHA